ncbi:A49-like RNA polymerase I associated factor-domain-containing protein [Haematococcus lacustris]
MADAHTAGAPEAARKRKRRSDAHGQPEITRGQQPSTSAMQVHVSVAPAGTQACSCYFPAGQPPTAAQFSLYALEQSNAKRGKLYTMVGQQDRMQWVGRSQGEDYAPGAQPVNQVLGVLDKQTGQLSLLPLCGGRVMRMEPRLPGLNYSMDASQAAGAEEEEGPETREQRLAANKKLVDSFGSTRRRRQLTAREEGVVRVEKLGDAAGTLSDLLTQVASNAAAQGLTKQQVAAAATDVRLLPPYVLDASSPEEAYPLSTLIPPDVGAALRIGKLLGAAESAESLQTLREKKWVHEAVLDRIVLLKDPDAAQVKRRARLLMFLSALLQLKAARPNLAVDLADGGLERLARSLHLNNDLLEPLLTLFYHTSMEGNRTRYTLSKEGEVRMVAFICVTSLLVEHNATLAPAQFSTLAGALRMPTDKLVARFREVGATCTPARAVKDVEADTAAPLVAPGRAYTCVLLPDRSKTLADVLPGIKLIKRK